jgi:hypothetical protein
LDTANVSQLSLHKDALVVFSIEQHPETVTYLRTYYSVGALLADVGGFAFLAYVFLAFTERIWSRI